MNLLVMIAYYYVLNINYHAWHSGGSSSDTGKQEKTCPQPTIRPTVDRFMHNNSKKKNVYMDTKRGVNVHVSVHMKKKVRCMWVKINMTIVL